MAQLDIGALGREALPAHINYFKPYMQAEENIIWIKTVNWALIEMNMRAVLIGIT